MSQSSHYAHISLVSVLWCPVLGTDLPRNQSLIQATLPNILSDLWQATVGAWPKA
jgi:hypothetical protein